MEKSEAIRDLEFIRRTMKASTRYTNIPPMGYLLAGLFGLVGPLYSWLFLGAEKIVDPSRITALDLAVLAVAWSVILLAAAFCAVLFSVLRARRLGKSAWNSLVSRMVFSQIPQLLAAGALTLGLAASRKYELIPAVWLISYGLILFSLFFFTGKDHLIQSGVFLCLGIGALFAPFMISLFILAAGFGATNLFFGVRGLMKEKEVYEAGTAQ
jgi:hypothetical protein